jgi:hypothetical protein
VRPLGGSAPRRRALFVRGMMGLGDNIMQRPFIRAAAAREDRLFLQTPWPELYADLPNVYPVRSSTRLRTQAKNERAWGGKWYPRPGGGREVRISYGLRDMAAGSMQQAMERHLPLEGAEFVWDLPDVGRLPKIDTRGKPLAIIRPVTEREEWLNSARNPRPEYIAQIAEALAPTHHVVCVADISGRQEWLVGDLPVCDDAFLAGEIRTMDLLRLMRQADVVVGGVGFIVPAALALKVRCFAVLGGQGAHNAPGRVVDPRADASRLGWAVPRSYCLCSEKSHSCDKTIDGLLEQFGSWARSQGVPYASAPARRSRRVPPPVA